jgi:hypothetical protein
MSAAAAENADDSPAPSVLVLMPAEVLAGSAATDQSGHWLALISRTAVASGGSDLRNLCVLELQPGGAIRDLADLGTAGGPIAWAPASDSTPARLVFAAPAPAAASGNGGMFGLLGGFSALRPPAQSSGLYMANLEAAGLDAAQPRRLGTSVNTVGAVWRTENTLLGFVRQDDGTLALRSIDASTGVTHDLGVRLPAGTAQGAGLSARWDRDRGRALLLTHPSNNGTASTASLRAWLVSFPALSSAAPAAH